PAPAATRSWTRTGIAIGVAALTISVVVVWGRRAPTGSGTVAPRNDWVQLTRFPDSVTQPSLSPDGRMVTFIRGPDSFNTFGQVYVKMRADGEAKALTNTTLRKMGPMFSPDGSRIVFTTEYWDTWAVPVLGGEPRLWLPNASGLVWSGKSRILFSEVIDKLE